MCNARYRSIFESINPSLVFSLFLLSGILPPQCVADCDNTTPITVTRIGIRVITNSTNGLDVFEWRSDFSESKQV
jgi:hypothetical protein